MTTLDKIKIKLIDKINHTENEQLLSVIDNIFEISNTGKKLNLNEYQIKMLEMSERDIENGDLISAEELERLDSEWMY